MVHKRLHHVGIILPTEEAVEDMLKMYGLEIDYHGETPYDTHFYFTKMNPAYSESPIEFLVPHSGKLAEFNHGKGGIHHICFEVDDVDAASEEYRQMGCELLHDVCEVSAKTMKINFIKPKSSHGILVELMQIIPAED